jgi:starch synthase
MRVFVTGTRGIPNVPGGVEKHCEELFPRVVARGHEVFLATRSCYVADDRKVWQGIRLVKCFAPRAKSVEAVAHTLIAVLKARRCHPDVLHIHAIGPSLLTPLARLMGFPVVVTNHGPEYDRQKWGRAAKTVLRFGEKVGGTWANEVIAVSGVIGGIVRKRCHRAAHVIYNGVTIQDPSKDTGFLEQIGAKPGKYVLAVARFVPEKGLHDLMEAFEGMKEDLRLVIAGDADHESDYSRRLKSTAAADARIILTGYITGESLRQVYSHAGLFVLPSYHEGLPIALLEAMSYGIPVLVSDIAANKEVGLSDEKYFRCGNVEEMRTKIALLMRKGLPESEMRAIRSRIEEKFNWDRIADQTIAVYRRALSPLPISAQSGFGGVAGRP